MLLHHIEGLTATTLARRRTRRRGQQASAAEAMPATISLPSAASKGDFIQISGDEFRMIERFKHSLEHEGDDAIQISSARLHFNTNVGATRGNIRPNHITVSFKDQADNITKVLSFREDKFPFKQGDIVRQKIGVDSEGIDIIEDLVITAMLWLQLNPAHFHGNHAIALTKPLASVIHPIHSPSADSALGASASASAASSPDGEVLSLPRPAPNRAQPVALPAATAWPLQTGSVPRPTPGRSGIYENSSGDSLSAQQRVARPADREYAYQVLPGQAMAGSATPPLYEAPWSAQADDAYTLPGQAPTATQQSSYEAAYADVGPGASISPYAEGGLDLMGEDEPYEMLAAAPIPQNPAATYGMPFEAHYALHREQNPYGRIINLVNAQARQVPAALQLNINGAQYVRSRIYDTAAPSPQTAREAYDLASHNTGNVITFNGELYELATEQPRERRPGRGLGTRRWNQIMHGTPR